MKTSFILPALTALCLASAVPTRAQVPPVLHYQGRIISNGTNFHGTGQFKFALVNANGQFLWGNSLGNPPISPVSIGVSNGLYSVLLGDTGIGNMSPLLPSVFNNSDVRLRVWFNNGVNGTQLLTPDQRIAAVGYALMAANVADGAITAGKLAAGAVSVNSLANGSITAEKLAPGAVSAALGSNLKIGSTEGICGRVDVYSTDIGTPGVTIDGCRSEVSAFIQANGVEGAELAARSYGGYLRMWDELGAITMEAGSASGGGGHITLHNTNSTRTLLLDGSDAMKGGSITVGNPDGEDSIVIRGEADGTTGGQISIFNPLFPSTEAVTIQAETHGGKVSVRGRMGSVDTKVSFAGAQQSFTNRHEKLAVSIQADNTITSRNSGGTISVRDTNGVQTVSIQGMDGDPDSGRVGGQINLYQTNGFRSVQIDGEAGVGKGGWIGLYRPGKSAAVIELDANAGGQAYISTEVLKITGGSDLSENFEIDEARATVSPGMIVSIDPLNPGALTVSSKAYDRTAAGIVSGAGGVKPGMLMGQHGTKADGKHPVALTGRVYCWVDADAGGRIEPGDLLTTSPTPGHGMRAHDSVKAHGAIIGKAMTSLTQGKGLVLVLVSLQ